MNVVVAEESQLTLPDRWYPLRYHPVQSKLSNSNVRFVAVPAGRMSGKTEIAKRKLITCLCDATPKPWRDPRYFFGGPTERQAKRIAWRDLLALIPPELIDQDGVSRSELSIRTVFGSELHIVGLDKPQRIEGVPWDGCVLDESSDLKPKIFELNVLPCLEPRSGWCWRIGVPKRHGVGAGDYKDFCMKARAAEECGGMEHFTWRSSEILGEEGVRWAKANLDARDYREQFDAMWEEAFGVIFHAFDRDLNVRKCEYNSHKPLLIGSDFNVDPMAWVIGHCYQNRVDIFDEIWLRDINTQKALDVLWARYGDHQGGFEFFGDATGRSRATSASKSDYAIIRTDERFIERGRAITYSKSNPAVVDRFASVNAMLCNAAGERRLFIDPACKQLIRDLEMRVFKPGTREADDFGDVGHMTDALGYPIHKLFRIGSHSEVPGAITISVH